MSYEDREYIHNARTPAEVLERVIERHGRPTASQLRRWVNTVLGPWDIPSEVIAKCKDRVS